MSGTLLIVDDERQLVDFTARLLRSEGFQVATAFDAAGARAMMARTFPDVVLMDLQLPDGQGTQLIEELQAEYPETRFIIITAHGSIRSAVEATRRGVSDYLTKPFEFEELLVSVGNALRERRLAEEVRRLRRGQEPDVQRPAPLADHGWRATAMREPMAIARRAAELDGIVLLLGESGTGKDQLARWIHRRSRRSGGPFFAINSAALSRELAEAELFGHEPGAFTGARGRKRGLLELAQGGTLLLNEIGELDPALQSKLLSFLDTKTFMRLGGEHTISVDARIIAATNRDLAAEVDAGRFRRDLYYRLNVCTIELPGLRQRKEDLSALVQDILEQLARELGLREPPAISEDGLAALERHSWPGNIRELRNVLERAVMITTTGKITERDLNMKSGIKRVGTGSDGELEVQLRLPAGRNLHQATREATRELVLEALRRAPTKKDAAALLGISRHALAHQLRVLGIEPMGSAVDDRPEPEIRPRTQRRGA